MYNEQATKKYIEIQHEIQDEIKKLQKLLNKHNSKATPVHYGHVGDVQRILAHLKQLTETEEEE